MLCSRKRNNLQINIWRMGLRMFIVNVCVLLGQSEEKGLMRVEPIEEEK